MATKESGFTLAELLVSLVITGIVTSMALPVGDALLSSFRGAAANNSLRHALAHARTEAITRSEVVRMCASDDGQWCSASGKWENGWITFLALSGESSRTASDPILRYQSAIQDLVIRKNGRERTVKFSAMGWIGLNRSFSICTDSGTKPHSRIVLIRSGRIRVDQKNIDCA